MEEFSDQVTAVLLAPVTVAVNCRVCPAPNVAADGLTFTAIAADGVRLTVALAERLASATEVAVTVTACCWETDGGAV
jgi:hypothetical protein